MPNSPFLYLGSAITDVYSFLGPADQHKLRRTSTAMCEWFDSAAENGSLAFFVTFAPTTTANPLRWKHVTNDPPSTGSANLAIQRATVTVHVRNYCLSTFNARSGGEVAQQTDDATIDKATIRLINFPFEHKLVVTGLFGIRSIGDNFCLGLKACEIEIKGEGSQLRSIGRDWMAECKNLRSVTFAGLTALEEIGYRWMYECSSLESIIFAGDMPNLKKVGPYWMSECSKLQHVDLIGFAALEEVGGNWLSYCSSLESIAFDMPNLKKVEGCWMYKCTKLKRVNLAGFNALEWVGNYWMSKCSSLESLTFTNDLTRVKKVDDCWMPNLKKVGYYWMSECSKLQQIDLTEFAALEEVGDSWLSGCESLESIIFASDMPNLKKVGSFWMAECPKLKHLNFECFSVLKTVGNRPLSDHLKALKLVLL